MSPVFVLCVGEGQRQRDLQQDNQGIFCFIRQEKQESWKRAWFVRQFTEKQAQSF